MGAREAPVAFAGSLPWGWNPAWAVLYPLTGVAAWLVWRRVDVGLERKRAALRRWGWQLLLSGLWAAALFGFQSPAVALLIMVPLLVCATLTFLSFLKVQKAAALLLLPHVVLLCCAAYLNADCFWLLGFSGMIGP